MKDFRQLKVVHKAHSLTVDLYRATAMLGCVLGDEECCAIRDSWRASIPIVVLSAVEFDALMNGNQVVFTPRERKEGK